MPFFFFTISEACFIELLFLYCTKVTIQNEEFSLGIRIYFIFPTHAAVKLDFLQSAALLISALSHSRHVLLPVSSMNLAMNDHCFFSAEPAQAMLGTGTALGGRLYITCQEDMLI